MVHFKEQHVVVGAAENGDAKHGTIEIQRPLEILKDGLLYALVRPRTCINEGYIGTHFGQYALHRDARVVLVKNGSQSGVPSRQFGNCTFERVPFDTRKCLDGKGDIESRRAGHDFMTEPMFLLAEGQREFESRIGYSSGRGAEFRLRQLFGNLTS